MVVVTFSLPSDAAEDYSVVSLAQFGEMGRVGGPRLTPVVQHGIHDFGTGHPYFEPERCGELVVH